MINAVNGLLSSSISTCQYPDFRLSEENHYDPCKLSSVSYVWADIPYSQGSNIGCSCGTVNTLCPMHTITLSFSSNSPVEQNVTLYVLLRGPLCIWFLHGLCPLWTSIFAHNSFMDQSLHKLSTTVPQWCFGAEYSSLVKYCASIHNQWHSTTIQLGGQLVTKMSNVYWQSLSESTSLCHQQLGHTSCSQPLQTDMPNHCMGSASAECSLGVSTYHGLHIGHQFLSWVFSPAYKESLSTGPMGLKTLRCWIY